MILSCPDCHKTYRVPSSAVPPGGREVRCSACGAAWHERGRVALRVAGGAAAADVPGYLGAADIVEGTCEAPPRQGPRGPRSEPSPSAPDQAARPAPRVVTASEVPPAGGAGISPARAQQRALTVHYALPPEPYGGGAPSGAAPVPGPVDRDALLAAAAQLLRVLEARIAALLGRCGEACRAGLAWLRRGLSARPAASTNAGDQAARRTRDALRAKAANRPTPMRLLGWTVWAAAAAGVALLAVAPERIAERAPALAALAPAPPAAPTLTVEARLTRYATSSQGPAASLTGVVRHEGEGGAVTPRLVLEAGAGEQTVPLPVVPLPPGGERPFSVRVLLPAEARAIRLSVRDDGSEASPPGFRLQQRGSGWLSGHAGPPAAQR